MDPLAVSSRSQGFPLGMMILLTTLAWIPESQAYRYRNRPNIVFVMSDDLGFNDVSYHGSVIQTPNIDRLAREGVRLENYYVQPNCSPSRLQLLSGKYQVNIGIQGNISPTLPSGFPLTIPTMAEVLKEAGYATHLVGKWHLGYFRPEFLPTNRGFDSFYGFLLGAKTYFNHTRMNFLDLRDNLKPDFSQNGTYATPLFTQKAIDVINAHEPGKAPLFLFLSHQAPHTPFEVPENYTRLYQNMTDEERKLYAGMVTSLDDGVGAVVRALQDKGLWENTVFVFSSDNGGASHRASSNFPLRGAKASLFEGGVRSVGFVTSPLLTCKNVISQGLIHITDWFPTFLRLAKSSFNTTHLDGIEQWDMIRSALGRGWLKCAPSARTELLHNIDVLFKPLGDRAFKSKKLFDTRIQAAIRDGDFKLITGDVGLGGRKFWSNTRNGFINQPREEFTDDPNKNLRLFNIARDPEERNDLSASEPQIVKKLLKRLQFYLDKSVAPFNPLEDPLGYPGNRSSLVWESWRGLDYGREAAAFLTG